jgi:hypothetical protein
MARKPLSNLIESGVSARPELPGDLVRFFAEIERVGLETTVDHNVRLCRLGEVQPVRCCDIEVLRDDEANGGPWIGFSGFQIGKSSYFDEIVYAVTAPVCQKGAIMVFGMDIAGPGGSGSAVIEPSLVLANSLDGWLAHLKRWNWTEFGITPGGINDLADTDQTDLRKHYLALNPQISWGSPT